MSWWTMRSAMPGPREAYDSQGRAYDPFTQNSGGDAPAPIARKRSFHLRLRPRDIYNLPVYQAPKK